MDDAVMALYYYPCRIGVVVITPGFQPGEGEFNSLMRHESTKEEAMNKGMLRSKSNIGSLKSCYCCSAGNPDTMKAKEKASWIKEAEEELEYDCE